MKWIFLLFLFPVFSFHLTKRTVDINLQGQWKIDAGGKKTWIPQSGSPSTPPASTPPSTPVSTPATPSPSTTPASGVKNPANNGDGTTPASDGGGGASTGGGSGGGSGNAIGGDGGGGGGGIGGNGNKGAPETNGSGSKKDDPKLWVILVPSILGFLLVSAALGYAAYRYLQNKKPPMVTGASLTRSNTAVGASSRGVRNEPFPMVIPVLANVPNSKRKSDKFEEKSLEPFQEISINDRGGRFSPPYQHHHENIPSVIPVQPALTVRNRYSEQEEFSPTLPSESYYNKRLASPDFIANQSTISVHTFGTESLLSPAITNDTVVAASAVGAAAVGAATVGARKDGTKTTWNNLSTGGKVQSDDLEAFGSPGRRLRSESITIEYVNQSGQTISRKDISKSYEHGSSSQLSSLFKAGMTEVTEEEVTLEEEQERTIHHVTRSLSPLHQHSSRHHHHHHQQQQQQQQQHQNGKMVEEENIREYLIEDSENFIDSDVERVVSSKRTIKTDPDGTRVIEETIEIEEGDERFSDLLETISQHTTEEQTQQRQRADGTWETVTRHVLSSPKLLPLLSPTGRIRRATTSTPPPSFSIN